MGEVINLFTRQPMDDNPDAIFDFIEEHLAAFLAEAEIIQRANTMEQLKDGMRQVVALVNEWPDLEPEPAR